MLGTRVTIKIVSLNNHNWPHSSTINHLRMLIWWWWVHQLIKLQPSRHMVVDSAISHKTYQTAADSNTWQHPRQMVLIQITISRYSNRTNKSQLSARAKHSQSAPPYPQVRHLQLMQVTSIRVKASLNLCQESNHLPLNTTVKFSYMDSIHKTATTKLWCISTPKQIPQHIAWTYSNQMLLSKIVMKVQQCQMLAVSVVDQIWAKDLLRQSPNQGQFLKLMVKKEVELSRI